MIHLQAMMPAHPRPDRPRSAPIARGLSESPTGKATEMSMKLPASVEEIASVIGRQSALYLVGQLPTCYAGKDGYRSKRVILYVPKRLKRSHRLVDILGWDRAMQLVKGFGGEILQPANCQEIYRRFRDREAKRLIDAGFSVAELAEMMAVSKRQIRNLTREMPQEE